MYSNPSMRMFYWEEEDTDKESIIHGTNHTETNVRDAQLLTMAVTNEKAAAKNMSRFYFLV